MSAPDPIDVARSLFGAGALVAPALPEPVRTVVRVISAGLDLAAALRDRGVNFSNPHSLLPTFTTANASAMATGHFFGDTGTYSNTIFSGFPLSTAAGSVTPLRRSTVKCICVPTARTLTARTSASSDRP